MIFVLIRRYVPFILAVFHLRQTNFAVYTESTRSPVWGLCLLNFSLIFQFYFFSYNSVAVLIHAQSLRTESSFRNNLKFSFDSIILYVLYCWCVGLSSTESDTDAVPTPGKPSLKMRLFQAGGTSRDLLCSVFDVKSQSASVTPPCTSVTSMTNVLRDRASRVNSL